MSQIEPAGRGKQLPDHQGSLLPSGIAGLAIDNALTRRAAWWGLVGSNH